MTSPFPLLAVQQAVYALLSTDTQLRAMTNGVWDNVPETTRFPYITLGEATEIPSNAHDRFGRDTTITLHVWTQSLGHSQGLEIGARVNFLLDHQPLAITGLAHVATLFEFSQTLTDPEPPGDVRHLVLRYRIRTEQLPT
ncbi:DUF3168 domain-containing protein [Streptomyces sp. NPDC006477]|uniref:DUF3168 domain-containing protein n=1 Tax=Streptomyces sp. NPDC006477 TaxID=3364747 RepID=UPI0036AB8342